MPAEPGDSKNKQRKLPERSDALRIDLPFEDAISAALGTKPPAVPLKRKRKASS
jgi:hypothetical protein